ncbi:MAG: YdcF family protein [Rubrivivax sp.]
MNDILITLGIESWKPTLSALLMPPLPFLLLILIGGRLMYRNRLLAWTLLLVGTLSIWAMCTSAVSGALSNMLLMPPRALSHSEIGDLKKANKTGILVLGAGRKLLSPEYGLSNLSPLGMERLRYGVWLAKETGLPLGFSGGISHGAPEGPSEAEIAARIAEREFGRPLKWTETLSRDTNENAARSLTLLRDAGIERIVLVTHDFHMRRSIAAFERAKQRAGITMEIMPAPMGLDAPGRLRFVDWLPSRSGFAETQFVLHEWIGRLAGA